MRVRTMPMLMCVCLILCAAKVPASAQVDQKLAASYFVELAEMCGRDDGRLWGVTLCGPMALVDAATRTSSTSEPAPPEPLPAAFGFANTALDWGGRRWSTIVWTMIQRVDAPTRRRLLVHEAFHRVQPQLGLMTGGADNVHLDALDARCWLVLEWRALAAALSAPIGARATALADAAAFRGARHRLSPAAADEERRVLIIEGLAQYTGTVLAHTSREAAIADARLQLERAEKEPTFVSVFAYSTGAAYGLLLDDVSPGWPRRITRDDDLGRMVTEAYRLQSLPDPNEAGTRYGAAEVRAAEERRAEAQRARIDELSRIFLSGPVLALPRTAGFNLVLTTTGATPLPDAGIVYTNVRVTADWGALEAAQALVSIDRQTVTVPAPSAITTGVVAGEGWRLTLAEGWRVVAGPRAGDYAVAPRTQ